MDRRNDADMVLGLSGLLCVTGAFGTGKSTLHPELITRLPGVVIYDMDELLEDGRLLRMLIADESARADWPAYNRLWSRLIAIPRRSDVPVVFLTPCFPDEFEPPEPARWLLLDCSDDERRRRLCGRGWDPDRIADALDDARRAREVINEVVSTDGEPVAVADRVADRIRQLLGPGADRSEQRGS